MNLKSDLVSLHIKIHYMKRILFGLFALIISAVFFSCRKELSNLNEPQTGHEYVKTEGPDINPLKGWISGWWNDYAYASVGFQYLKWKDFEPVNNQFNFSAVEEVLSRPGTIGRHFILRLYCDWAGTEYTSNAGPAWLFEEVGVKRLESNGRFITDYNDEKFQTEAEEAIKALADHFDDSPRAYAFQIGILGFWGEWHTSGFDGYKISTVAKERILKAYTENFINIRCMGRYPWVEPLASSGIIGFHNDYFGPHPHSDDFDSRIFSDKKWLEGPIGGEVPPNFSEADMNLLYATSDGIDMIKKGHYSTMQTGSPPCTTPSKDIYCSGFMKMHRLMGYNYQIEKCIFPETLPLNDSLYVDLYGFNIGVAPMYYDWDVQFALIDNVNVPVMVFDVSYDLTAVLPGDSISITLKESVNTINMGNYRLAIRIIQPGADEPKSQSWNINARNTYILFSNVLPVINGAWGANDQLIGGWSILGKISII